MATKHIDYATTFKAVEGEAPGSFEAVVAVFGNVDRAGEVIEHGAFKGTLADKADFPVIWSHQWLTPPIGVGKAVETPEGLRVKGQLFVESVDLARHVWTAMKAGALNEWSVGLNVKSERQEERDGESIVVLEELDLIELGPCLKGVNPATYTASVKAVDIDGDKFDEAIAETQLYTLAEARKALELEISSSEVEDTERVAPSDAPAPSGALSTEDKRRIIDVLFP